MATLVIQKCFQVSINMVQSARPVTNVIGIFSPGTKTADEVGAAVKAAWEVAAGPLKTHSTSTVMRDYKTVDIGSTTGAVSVIASAATGGVAGALAVMSGSGLVTYGTGTRSRSARGRMYHGPLTTNQVGADGRSLGAGTQASLLSAYVSFDQAITVAGLEWVVLSRKYGVYHPISSIGVSPFVATQRRRMRS